MFEQETDSQKQPNTSVFFQRAPLQKGIFVCFLAEDCCQQQSVQMNYLRQPLYGFIQSLLLPLKQ